MKQKRIVGLFPFQTPDYTLIRKAGVDWIRVSFPYPFKDKLNGEYTGKFLETMEKVKDLHKKGFKIMGITPLPGVNEYDREKKSQWVWHPHIPEWAGEMDSDRYYDAYEKGCEKMAGLTAGLVDMWQVSNEMDIIEFRGSMTKEMAARFMLAGGRGVKKGNSAAMAGINPSALYDQFGPTEGKWFFENIYTQKDHPFDFAGIDGYFGSWIPGGVEDWIPWIDEISDITHLPVLINEWGYSSLGGLPKPPIYEIKPGLNSVCDTGTWHYAWKKEHSDEEQCEYIRTGLKIFATYPNVMGSFFFCWSDPETCWHCGGSACPAECGWGLIDNMGRPKAAYEVFKKTVHEFY